MANSKIKFKHFCGTLDLWNAKKTEWSDAIVFGRIHTEGKWLYKIYAGAIQGEDPNLYEYNFVTAEDFSEFEKRLKALETELNTDIDPSIGSIVFVDEDFKEALKNTINLLFAKYKLTAENFVKLVDSSNSNVKVSINNSSLVLEADSATTDDVTSKTDVGYVKLGTTIPEGTTLQQLVNMIFTKIRGLEGANAPFGSISGIPATTMEVGAKLGSSITVTAGFADGSWKNEGSWKNSYSGNQPIQPYGSTATNYTFSGMVSGSGATNTIIVPADYIIVKDNNNVQVVITNTNSSNVPVNEAGENLKIGSNNDTEHYIPYIATNITKTSATIKGDYKYWIGYTTIEAKNITRAIADRDLKFKTGWAGTNVVCQEQFNSPQNSYATFIVPKGMTLKEVTDSFNNDVVANFTATDVNELGADSKVYTVYQEYAAASVGIDRKNIKLN